MKNIFFIEFSVFIAIIMLLVINQFRMSLQRLPEERIFVNILKILIVLVFANMVESLEVSNQILPKEAKYFFSFINIIGFLFIPYLWNLFIHYKIYGSAYHFRKYIVPITLPLIMGILFCITRNHQAYLSQKSFNLINLDYITHAISIFYLVMASVLSFRSAYKNNTQTGKRLEMFLCWIMLIPISAIILQTFVFSNSISIIYPIFVLVFLHIYVSSQNTLITLDYLTGLNNNRRLNTYLRDKTLNLTSGQRLFILIITLDNISLIRKNFGKKKEDEILVSFADFLRSMMNDNSFLAHHKRNSFAIVLEKNSWKKIEAFCNTLIQKSTQHPIQKIVPWNQTFSINYSEFGKPGINNVIKLLDDTKNNCYKPATTMTSSQIAEFKS